jgi:DNA-binding transcriptional regulator YiaG
MPQFIVNCGFFMSIFGEFMNYTALFAAIKVAMKKKNLCVNQLASLSGCDPQTLTNWLNGIYEPKTQPSVTSVFKMIDMLKIDAGLFATVGDTIGSRIRYLRIKNQLTPWVLSGKVGCAEQAVSSWEANVNKPSTQSFLK